jgi:hypothetical protein
MNVSNVPSLQDIFKANKPVWKKYRFNLIFGAAATITMWLLEGLFNLRIIQVIPVVGGSYPHFIPEWYMFFVLGCFTAEVKKTLIPTELLALIIYPVNCLFVLVIVFGWSTFQFVALLLFSSPFLFGYLIKRIHDWREARKRQTAGAENP